jgi:hypothetical protein
MMQRRYSQQPQVVTGYTLDDIFSIVVPIARTNLVTNPSFETNTTSWGGAFFGAIARVATQQYHGAYSLQVTPTTAATDGATYTVALVAGTTYALSCKFLGVPGVRYQLAFYTLASVKLVSVEFVGTGRWQWVWAYYTETASNSRAIIIGKASGTSTTPFYIDGVQVEALSVLTETVSTYIDGDQQGLVPNQQPPAFLWAGTPHASTSSRSGLTRAGGMVVKLKDYNFLLTAIVGLGLALPQNIKTDYARIDGAYDDYTRKPTRQFSLTGRFSGRSYQELRDNRSGVARLFDRDLVGLDQRMTLLHHIEGPCGDTQTNESRILCKYVSGLGGNTDNQVAENAAISFEQYLPFVVSDGEAGSALSVQSTFTANRIAIRTPAGVWSSLGTGGNAGEVTAITRGTNGIYYIGGSFTSFNGVANTIAIVQYDPSSGIATAMGSGAGSGQVLDLQVAPNGDIWAMGTFLNMGGIAAADYVARWDGSAWNAVGTPSADGGANVQQSTFGADGAFYYPTGGNLTVRKWNGSAWSTLGTATGGVGASVDVVIRAPNGDLIAAGNFTTMGGVAANSVARYSITAAAWQSMNSSFALTEIVRTLAFDLAGNLYAGTTPVATTPLWIYNGATWTRVSSLTGTVFAIGVTPAGLIGVGGTIAGEPSLIDRAGFWNGAAFSPLDIDLPGTPNVYRIWTSPDGTIAVGFDTAGTATAPGVTTPTNGGTAKTYPTLRLNGPSSGTARIYELLNTTTGRSIYLNYTMNVGEMALLQFQPDNLSFVSSFVGNIANTILPGSSEADFFLAPGANTIVIFSTGSTATGVIYWRPQFTSLDDVR